MGHLNLKSFFTKILFLGLVLLLGVTLPHPVNAQFANPDWTTPVDLSTETGYPGWFPRITVDQAGNFHVFWIGQTIPGKKDEMIGNTIYYRTWDGKSWSTPVDIFASEDNLSLADVLTTRDGKVAVLWYTSGNNLYLSMAPIQQANDVHAWQTNLLRGAASWIKLSTIIL